jgi:hypothetical protein
MARSFAIIVLGILAAGILAGCTNSSTPTPTSTPSTTTTTMTPTASTPTIPTVTYQGTATSTIDEKFDTTAVGRVPAGWANLSGEWGVVANESAPSSPNAIMQTQAIPNVFNILADKGAGTFGNFNATVSMYIVHGDAEMTAGIAFRIVDNQTYYAIDYDQNEGVWSLYKWVNGGLTKIASTDENAPAAGTDQWLTMTVLAQGNHIEGIYNGEKVIDYTEYQPNAPTVGSVGLWSRDETNVLFDNFHVTTSVSLT